MLTSQPLVSPAHMEFTRKQGYSCIAFIVDLLTSQKREVYELLGEQGIPTSPPGLPTLHLRSYSTVITSEELWESELFTLLDEQACSHHVRE